MTSTKIGLKQAPYDSKGSLLHFAGYGTGAGDSSPGVTWRDNDPFHATLQVVDMRSGRSAKYVILKHPNSDDERAFPMFVTELLDMLAATTVHHGIVSGRWQVRKRGQNYGLVYLGES